MNLLCPQCQKMLAIADQYAGQLMKCPLCGNTFTAPLLPDQVGIGAPAKSATAAASASTSPGTTHLGTSSSGSEEIFQFASPPSANPPLPPFTNETPKATSSPSAKPPISEIAGPSLPAGYFHTRTIWISPRGVPWIAPGALLVVLILSFCSWVKYFDSKGVIQERNAWGLAFGEANWLLIIYILLLLTSFLVATAAVVLPRSQINLPPLLEQIMPYRAGVVAGVVLLAFFFLFLQVVTGFKQEGPAYAHTNWLRLAVTVHFFGGVVGAALDFWLFLRKSRPLPRIDISW
jgi:hypothetical protein